MSPSTLISRRDILAMLDHCAPGYKPSEKKHHLWISYNGRIYMGLSKGQHGDRRQQVESGTVRQMVTYLGVSKACAQSQLPILGFKTTEE